MIDFDKLIAEPASLADILTGSTVVVLGGEEVRVPARSSEGDEEWVAGLDVRFRGLLTSLDAAGDSTTRVLAVMSAFPKQLAEALVAYQPDVLPSVAELRRKATSAELLIAVARVWRLANPLAAIAMAGMATNGTPGGRGTSSRARSAKRSGNSAKG